LQKAPILRILWTRWRWRLWQTVETKESDGLSAAGEKFLSMLAALALSLAAKGPMYRALAATCYKRQYKALSAIFCARNALLNNMLGVRP